MIGDKRIAVVMPAYNVEPTLARTVNEIDRTIVDDVILVDNKSHDDTVRCATDLEIFVFCHPENKGFGGNLKQGYRLALQRGADIVVTLHPDYQYEPRLVPAMAHLLGTGVYHAVLGSRVLCGDAKKSGMPLPRYVANRILTWFQNTLLRTHLSEFHTGYRAYSRELLSALPLEENSNDFLFDNQILMQTIQFGFKIGEISCPTRYLDENSSISYWRSVVYSLGLIKDTFRLVAHRLRLVRNDRLFGEAGRKLLDVPEEEIQGMAIDPALPKPAPAS